MAISSGSPSVWKGRAQLFICILLPILLLQIPTASLPLFNDISVMEHRLLAIFMMAVMMWVLEPIPVFATSVLVIMLELLLVSDKGLAFLMTPEVENFGKVLSYKSIMHSFSEPIILLFLGGFFLAAAATKYRLDLNLARVLLRPFGEKPANVMLGLMGVTAIFSMFMSNTATTAMMLALLVPILKTMPLDDKGRITFALAIPFAANIGGIGTPIGTPPNAVAQKYLTGENAIAFADWMVFSVPYVVVMLLLTWIMLCRFFPISIPAIKVDINSRWQKGPQAFTVYTVFGLTIFLWIFAGLLGLGLTSHIIAMLPVTVFCATRIITPKDLKQMDWDVLWLVAGGLALGSGLKATGLSKSLVEVIPFDSMSGVMIIAVGASVAMAMSTFMSNTATAALILPIMAALGTGLPELAAMGGTQMIVIACTFACSMAMAMPISTPPNALAYATGFLSTKDMGKAGIFVGIVGLCLSFVMLFIMSQIGYFG
jgi:solute carrier family 13 (sodium-dependent dicarboxylate transporter), member 2/3/5